MSNTEKIYCGSAKAVTTQYGEMWNLNLEVDQLQGAIESARKAGLLYVGRTGKEYLSVKIGERRELGKDGSTHFLVVIDANYKKREEETTQATAQATTTSEEGDGLPF